MHIAATSTTTKETRSCLNHPEHHARLMFDDDPIRGLTITDEPRYCTMQLKIRCNDALELNVQQTKVADIVRSLLPRIRVLQRTIYFSRKSASHTIPIKWGLECGYKFTGKNLLLPQISFPCYSVHDDRGGGVGGNVGRISRATIYFSRRSFSLLFRQDGRSWRMCDRWVELSRRSSPSPLRIDIISKLG
jgi:hypothetical protein